MLHAEQALFMYRPRTGSRVRRDRHFRGHLPTRIDPIAFFLGNCRTKQTVAFRDVVQLLGLGETRFHG